MDLKDVLFRFEQLAPGMGKKFSIARGPTEIVLAQGNDATLRATLGQLIDTLKVIQRDLV
jgi:hypothetical protein